MASTLNFDLIQGDSIEKTITADAFDLSSYTPHGQMRRSLTSPYFIDFVMSYDPVTLVISWYLSPVVSALLLPGKYFYQIEITDSTSSNITLLVGEINVIAEISKPTGPTGPTWGIGGTP